MTRVSTLRWIGIAWIAAALMASAEEAAPGAGKPIDPCVVTLRSPKVLATSGTTLPVDFWTTKPRVTAHVHFRVDESGNPMNVSTTADGVAEVVRPSFEQAVSDSFSHYRFCRPGDFSTERTWTATLLYSPVPTSVDANGARMYLQSFVPAFVNFERFGHHSGGVVVRGIYGPDGSPRAVEIVSSGGDQVIDNKSLDAMATARVLFRDAPPAGPIRLVRSFSFRE